MKILFDHQKFTKQRYGGITRYYYNLTKELVRLKHNVKIFAPFFVNEYIKDLPNEIVHGQYFKKTIPYTTALLYKYNHFQTNKFVKRWQPDVIHETYYSKKGYAGLKCVKVLTVYDMIHERFKDVYFNNDNTTYLKKNAVSRADHIICISENTRKDLINIFGVEDRKTSTVYLGFNGFFKKTKEYELFNNATPYLLYVGARENYKNFITFIKAVASSNMLRSTVDIIAFGGGPFNKNETQIIHRLGFKPNQVKQMDGDDMVLGNLYHNSLAFVFPSLYEGFGIPLLEAMAHGCPIVSSNTSSMPEVIGDAAEYFDPKSIESMRNSIENVVSSETKRSELIQLGNNRLKIFSWAKCAKKTLDIYKSLIYKC